MLIRGFYYEGWHPTNKPFGYRHKEDFLQKVRAQSPGLQEPELERAITAVFNVLSNHISVGEIEQVRNQLPAEIRELWSIKAL